MAGVKVVEVAQFTFTPSAGAVLADWGADVIKIEHPVAGDAQRGLKLGTGAPAEGSFSPLMEGPNRGKRSIGLALDTPKGREILNDLVRSADVFVVNFLPEARRRLKIEVDDIRSVNPDIIYVRGSAHGQKGPDAESGGYDGSAFWSRVGPAMGVTPSDSPRVIEMPTGAFGDNLGGMTIAGGVAAALFARERTGEPSVVDVSLMGVGAWAMSLSVNIGMLLNMAIPQEPLQRSPWIAANPLIGNYRTKDGRWINLTMLQPGRYWAPTCRKLGLEHLIDDERFATAEAIMTNVAAAGEYVAEAIASRTYDEWKATLQDFEGQWAPNQNALEVAEDPQVVANGYVATVLDADGNERRLVSSPVQFDETPFTLSRAPLFAEHTDDIIRELGYDDEQLIELKIEGTIT